MFRRRASAPAARAGRATVTALVVCIGLLVTVSGASAIPGIAVTRYGNSAATSSNLSKYAVVDLGMSSYPYVSQIKSANPSTMVVGYKSGVEMSDNCGGVELCNSGITYQ